MKRIFTSLIAVAALAVILVSCNTNSPKGVAEKWLTSFYHMDYEAAKEVSTEQTKSMLDMMQSFSAMMADSAKAEAKKIKVDVKDVKEEGDKATVTYTTSSTPTDQTLNMVKENGKWLVQFSKQDMGAGEQEETTEEGFNEAMSDTTGATTTETPTDGATTTPSSADTAVAR